MAFATGSHACGPAGAHTLASNHVARVYVVHDVVYGCSGSQTSRLGGGAHDFRDRVGPVALAGSVTAYGVTSSGIDTITGSVIVRRLSDGKQLRKLPATTLPLGAEFFQAINSIVVRTSSAVAWIGSATSIGMRGHRDVEVLKADSHGEGRLDSGAAIKLSSLRLDGANVTWVHGTQTRSAPLH